MKLNDAAPSPPSDPTYPKNWPHDKISPACTRFGARFRVAKTFQSVTFSEGIWKDRADTYSALIRFMTVYSTWDIFRRAFGVRSDAFSKEFEQKYPPLRIKTEIQREPKHGITFMKFLASTVSESKLKEKMFLAASGKIWSPLSLSEAVRHVYVHGDLTASPWDIPPARIKAFVDALSDYLLSIMDEEAGSRAFARLSKQKKG